MNSSSESDRALAASGLRITGSSPTAVTEAPRSVQFLSPRAQAAACNDNNGPRVRWRRPSCLPVPLSSSGKDRGAFIWACARCRTWLRLQAHAHRHTSTAVPPPSCPSPSPTSSLFTPLHQDICSPSVAAIVMLRTNSGFSHWWCEIKQPPRPLMISGVLSSCCGYLLSHSTRSRFQGWSWELEFTIVKKMSEHEGERVWKIMFQPIFFGDFSCCWLPHLILDWTWILHFASSLTRCTHVAFSLNSTEHGFGVWCTGKYSEHDNYILCKGHNQRATLQKTKSLRSNERAFYSWANYLFEINS